MHFLLDEVCIVFFMVKIIVVSLDNQFTSNEGVNKWLPL